MTARETVVKRILSGDLQLLRDLRKHAEGLSAAGDYAAAGEAWDTEAEVLHTISHPTGGPQVGDAIEVQAPDSPSIVGVVVAVHEDAGMVDVRHETEVRTGEGITFPEGHVSSHPYAQIVALLPLSQAPTPVEQPGLVAHAMAHPTNPHGGTVAYE